MTGDLSLNPTDILNMLSDDIMGEIRECTDDVIILFIIAAISGIITTISTSFGNKSTSEAAFFACFTPHVGGGDKMFRNGYGVRNNSCYGNDGLYNEIFTAVDDYDCDKR